MTIYDKMNDDRTSKALFRSTQRIFLFDSFLIPFLVSGNTVHNAQRATHNHSQTQCVLTHSNEISSCLTFLFAVVPSLFMFMCRELASESAF